MDEFGTARAVGRKKPEIRPQHCRSPLDRTAGPSHGLVQHDIADRNGVIFARVLAERLQPTHRFGQIAHNRLFGDAASMNKPGPECAKARIFFSDTARRRQSTVAQELKKCSSASPPSKHARGGQPAAFATKKALAVVLSEPFDVGVTHDLRANPRQAEPMNKMLRTGNQHASASSAVAQGDEVIAIRWQ
ncbi:MAG: hypothetical protein AB7U61_07705 [Methylocystis sp.]